MATQNRFVALLRGINVGGKNRLAMADLRELFETAGCSDVATYIQSGNVAFSAPRPLAGKIATVITRQLKAERLLEVPVLTRSLQQLKSIIEKNPYADKDPKFVHVGFLGAAPSAAQRKSLDPHRSPGDEFVVSGSELYFHCPNGVAKSKLTNAWFDRQLRTTTTIRNWRTTNKLLELASE